jgi:hypothetical protein
MESIGSGWNERGSWGLMTPSGAPYETERAEGLVCGGWTTIARGDENRPTIEIWLSGRRNRKSRSQATGTMWFGWGWRLIPLLGAPVAKRLARIAARLRPALSRIEGLGDGGYMLCRGRALERKRGLSLAAVMGLQAQWLGRIATAPAPGCVPGPGHCFGGRYL